MIHSDESGVPIEIYVQWALIFALLKTFHYPTLCVIFTSVRNGPTSVRYLERTPLCVWLSHLCAADPELCVCAFMGNTALPNFCVWLSNLSRNFHLLYCKVQYCCVICQPWFAHGWSSMVEVGERRNKLYGTLAHICKLWISEWKVTVSIHKKSQCTSVSFVILFTNVLVLWFWVLEQ